VARLRAAGEVAGVAIETTRHLVMHALLEAGFTVYAINPKLSHAWRKGVSVVEAKSDGMDAWVLAEGLRVHHGHLRSYIADDAQTRQLAMLCHDEQHLIEQRTALVSALQAALKQYFPLALQWFSKWSAPAAWDFILTFPTPQALKRATKKKLCGFLARHYIGLGPIWQQRIAARDKATTFMGDIATTEAKSMLAVGLAKQLRTLQAVLEIYRDKIEMMFDHHPDAALFKSLPGAGPKLAPRIATIFGCDRLRYASAHGVQELTGTVPVTRQSGRSKTVAFRRACRKPFRNTMHQFAFCCLRNSVWARAYYDAARRQGQSHAQALRNLGARWLKIIYRMWVERTPYDEQRYLDALVRRNSPLAHQLRLKQTVNNL